MSKESYARGFCKAAEAAGVDPRALAKFAQSVIGSIPNAEDIKRAVPTYRSAASKFWDAFKKTYIPGGRIPPRKQTKYAAQNAAMQAKTNANLMMMRQKIKPMIAKLMKGARNGETRMNSPELQRHIDAYLQAGGKADDLYSKH